MEPIWLPLSDWMVNKVSFPGCSPLSGWKKRKKESRSSSGLPGVGSGKGERFNEWRTWQCAVDGRWGGKQIWMEMLDAIRDVINASFRLTGQHLKGYNSRWLKIIKKELQKSSQYIIQHFWKQSKDQNQTVSIRFPGWSSTNPGAYPCHLCPVNAWH